MKPFLLFMSFFWIFVGTAFILSPLKLKKLYTHLIKPAKALFIMPLLFGLIFLWASPASNLEGLIKVLGIIALTKGIFLLVCPINVIRSTFNWWLSLPNGFYRLLGVFAILLGVVVGWSVL
ncbi:MAG: hypothetical protein KKD90_05800 [Candidatus Omnitrophica bacterium]|nr:hypothetical protein [Candidatus Omnitrophota bacterium]MBU4149881.1 hypothetical protein [Candidatus Omnitrophota bacterium]